MSTSHDPDKTNPATHAADLLPEKAYAALSRQLETLQELKKLRYLEGKAKETEWAQLTGNIIIRAFDSDSLNPFHFSHARNAGQYSRRRYGATGENYALHQHNYEARIQACEGVLNSCLAELKLDLPEPEIQSVFEPGQEYEFYRAVKTILGFAATEIFVIDPYINAEMFDVYAGSIPRTVSFRLLSNAAKFPAAVLALAQKYATGGNLQVRSSADIHDRVIFADNRVWVCGQSLKDAAKTKPTYIVEHDEPLMRRIYEDVWANATRVV